MTGTDEWRRCNACKGPIAFGALYWVCNVSTCNRKRTAMRFCSVSCWEVHLPTANHREAWAVEKNAPATAAEDPELQAASPDSPRPKRRILPTPQATAAAAAKEDPLEVLIIASRLKEFIRAESGYNTSDRVLEPLSKIVRRVCKEAIQNAGREERRTVLDRDIPS